MIDNIVGTLRAFWGLWVMGVFIGIVAWAYWPKNKAKIEAYAQIALRNDENEER